MCFKTIIIELTVAIHACTTSTPEGAARGSLEQPQPQLNRITWATARHHSITKRKGDKKHIQHKLTSFMPSS